MLNAIVTGSGVFAGVVDGNDLSICLSAYFAKNVQSRRVRDTGIIDGQESSLECARIEFRGETNN